MFTEAEANGAKQINAKNSVMSVIKLKRKLWQWRCIWSLISASMVGMVVYNGMSSVWVVQMPGCGPAAILPSAPPTCEPCLSSGFPTTTNNIPDDDPIARLDLRLGRLDHSRYYKLFDFAAVGEMYAELSTFKDVCLATQASVERIHDLLGLAEHWTGPISVAVFVTGDEMVLLRGYQVWLSRCRPDLFSRMALHVAMPVNRLGEVGNLPEWTSDCSVKPMLVGERKADTVGWRNKNPYPQNHLRNQARKNCQTHYTFLVDIDIVPSKDMSNVLETFLANTPKCALCAYVIPTYELDYRVENFPANKSEVLRLSAQKLAVPFHKKVFIYNQYASNFSRWEASGGNESSEVHVSHNVTNFEFFYEPFYVAPDTVPPHDERFIGYGFTRNTQVSMVLNGNSFCGGFIISRDYVLTAAHCVQNVSPPGVRLRVGSTRRDSGGRIVPVSNITVHERYGRPRFDNDIAALRLATPLTLTPTIRPIRLPQPGQAVPLVRLTVTGWGLTAPRGRRIPRVMMEAQVPVVPHWLCRLSYGNSLTPNMFCGGHFLIGGVSSCQVYEMYLLGYQFQVLSPIFTIHWGLQTRQNRKSAAMRDRQNTKNSKIFQTVKRELFARYRKDPLHLLKRVTVKKA